MTNTTTTPSDEKQLPPGMEGMRDGLPQLRAACEAAEQCIVDFIDVYKRGCSMLVLDEAVKSLRGDALVKVQAALAIAGRDITAPREEKRSALALISKHLASCLAPGTPLCYRNLRSARFIGSGRKRLATAEVEMFDGQLARIEVFQHGEAGLGHRWTEMSGGAAFYEDGHWQRECDAESPTSSGPDAQMRLCFYDPLTTSHPRPTDRRGHPLADKHHRLAARVGEENVLAGSLLDRVPRVEARVESAQDREDSMTLDDPMWDDLWHGIIWSAYVTVAREHQGWPQSEAVKQRAYRLYEEELAGRSEPPDRE